jgi:hypothetical protein
MRVTVEDNAVSVGDTFVCLSSSADDGFIEGRLVGCGGDDGVTIGWDVTRGGEGAD